MRRLHSLVIVSISELRFFLLRVTNRIYNPIFSIGFVSISELRFFLLRGQPTVVPPAALTGFNLRIEILFIERIADAIRKLRNIRFQSQN